MPRTRASPTTSRGNWRSTSPWLLYRCGACVRLPVSRSLLAVKRCKNVIDPPPPCRAGVAVFVFPGDATQLVWIFFYTGFDGPHPKFQQRSTCFIMCVDVWTAVVHRTFAHVRCQALLCCARNQSHSGFSALLALRSIYRSFFFPSPVAPCLSSPPFAP